ncbi:MAG: hypothetical protein HY698_03445 [Deltaproteobacteria bacterium]|nr:hypothetical protein [Deltaproteobacteria bacterium]
MSEQIQFIPLPPFVVTVTVWPSVVAVPCEWVVLALGDTHFPVSPGIFISTEPLFTVMEPLFVVDEDELLERVTASKPAVQLSRQWVGSV